MGQFPVGAAKAEALAALMKRVGLSEGDLTESFIRSGGPGGQNVNKTATCVHLRHAPSGLGVKCARTRTQGLNRYYARLILAGKLEDLIEGRRSAEQARREKIRRQKRRRSRRAKEKMLAGKRHTAEKKKQRTFRPLKPQEEG